MLERSAIRLLRLDSDDIPRIRQLMRKYTDRRIDLADAALVPSRRAWSCLRTCRTWIEDLAADDIGA